MRRRRAKFFESKPKAGPPRAEKMIDAPCSNKKYETNALKARRFFEIQAQARAPGAQAQGRAPQVQARAPRAQARAPPSPSLGPPPSKCPRRNSAELGPSPSPSPGPPQRTPQEEIPQSGENEENENEKTKLALAQPGEHFPFPNASHLLQSISRLGGAATPPNSDLFKCLARGLRVFPKLRKFKCAFGRPVGLPAWPAGPAWVSVLPAWASGLPVLAFRAPVGRQLDVKWTLSERQVGLPKRLPGSTDVLRMPKQLPSPTERLANSVFVAGWRHMQH